jgi:hypothetical protein
VVVVALTPGAKRIRRPIMFGWWRRWRKTVARQKKRNQSRTRRRERFSDWDAISRYGDPFDGA